MKKTYLENINKLVIFENENFIIINKPPKLPVHKGTGHEMGLINLLLCNKKYINKKLMLAHRLDKNTSGCIVVAKNKKFLSKFHMMLKNKLIKKEYHAIVYGQTKKKFKIITKQNILNKYNKKIKENDLITETNCETIKYYANYSLLRILLITGKMHQIRIHLTHIGHPIICDSKYGNMIINKNLNKINIYDMFLHANTISFVCPLTNVRFFIKAIYNKVLKKILFNFEKEDIDVRK